MRLSSKLALAVLVAVGALVSLQAISNVQVIEAVHSAQIRADHARLAERVAIAIDEMGRSGGEDAVDSFIERIDRVDDGRRVRVVSQGELPAWLTDQERGRIDDPSKRSDVSAFERGNTLISIVKVLPTSETPRYVIVSGGRGSSHQMLTELIGNQVTTTVALLLLGGLLTMGLGLWFIGRPVEALIAQARHVGDGRFEQTDLEKQNDEIGYLAKELNLMVARLANAKQAVLLEKRARTEALEQLRHADRLSTMGKLASGIAHELGTPLNVVSGRAMMIAGETEEPETKENAKIIVAQTKSMTRIIRSMLDFARRGPQPEDALVAEVVKEAVRLVEPLAEDRGVIIDPNDCNGLRADLDRGKVLQVLTNIMVNGIQAMPNGGNLRIKVAEKHVDSPPDKHAKEGEYVQITVEDDGIGIDQEDLSHIFEPYFTTKRAGNGSGIGLSVCHGIVREHGGFIEVDSARGQGSRFSIHLPKRGDA